jgi:hypothetical protein
MLHAGRVQSGAMGYSSPSLNEKLASYHAADLRAGADARRKVRAAHAVLDAAPEGSGPGHHAGPPFGPDRIWRWRERLGLALVEKGFSLLAGHHGRSRRGAIISINGRGPTGQPIATPIDCGCHGSA